jgi:hypothetical protein
MVLRRPGRCQDLPQGQIPVGRRRGVSPMFGWKMIHGASGEEFVFINAQVGSIGKAINAAPCG